jgi:hypothetical protein
MLIIMSELCSLSNVWIMLIIMSELCSSSNV